MVVVVLTSANVLMGNYGDYGNEVGVGSADDDINGNGEGVW